MPLDLMAENISPEERLFKVIHEGGKPPLQKVIRWKLPWPIDFSGLKRFFAGLAPGSARAGEPGLRRIDFKSVNNALSVILVVITALVIYRAVYERPSLTKVTSVISANEDEILKLKPTEAFKPLDFYTERAKKRDIFHPVSMEVKGASAGLNIQGLAKDLALAGIYQGPDRHFEAIIEDQPAKKTYFLKIGDEIKGLKIKAILKDRVVLRYREEEMELL